MIDKMKWLRQPKDYQINENSIEVTMPHTDLWQRTYYHINI